MSVSIPANANPETTVGIYNSDGTPKTDVTSATSGLAIKYRVEPAGSVTSVTPASLATPQAAWAQGGIVHIGNGLYRVCPPAAAVTTAGTTVEVWIELSGSQCVGGKIVVDQTVNSRSSHTAAAAATAVRSELTTELARIDATVSSRSTYAGGAVASVTAGVTLAATQTAYAPAKAGDAMALTSGERTTLVGMVWSALTSGMTTAGTIGAYLVDILAAISLRTANITGDRVILYYPGRTVTGVAITTAADFSETFSIDDVADIEEAWFTIKGASTAKDATTDALAYVQISMTGGLLRLNRDEAADDTLGTLTINTETGIATATLKAAATKLLPDRGNLIFDLKVKYTDGRLLQKSAGTVEIISGVTQAVA